LVSQIISKAWTGRTMSPIDAHSPEAITNIERAIERVLLLGKKSRMLKDTPLQIWTSILDKKYMNRLMACQGKNTLPPGFFAGVKYLAPLEDEKVGDEVIDGTSDETSRLA
jgi:hypothetical protein